MALLLSSLAAPFDGRLDYDWAYGSPQAPMLMRCGAACAPPLGLLLAAPARLPPAAAYRLQRHSSYAPPTEPEVHVRRTPEGVLAACPLGRGFSSQDISLHLSGRDFTITAFHPGTAHWHQRPAAYRRVLDLADHIDAQCIEAALERGVLTLFFPYRRQQPRLAPMHITVSPPMQQRPRLVFVHAGGAPATAPAVVHAAPPASARPITNAAPAAVAAPPASACAPPSSKAAAAPCSFRRAHHRGLQRWNIQHPMQLRCLEQDRFGPPAPTPSSAQRHSPLSQQRPPTASPQRRTSPAAPTEPLLRPASPPRPITIPVEGPTPTSSTAEAPKAGVPVPAPAVQDESVASPAAADISKGKAAASPEQAADLERRQRAAAAQARIAAGVGSDSDWEDADGMVSDCSLEN